MVIDIKGIYGWGKGIKESDKLKFNAYIRSCCDTKDIIITDTFFGVLRHDSDNLSIYFHPMETVISGNDLDKVNELTTYFKQSLELGPFNLELSIRK